MPSNDVEDNLESPYTVIEDGIRIRVFPQESKKLTKHNLGDDVKQIEDPKPQGPDREAWDFSLTIRVNSTGEEFVY